MLKLLPAVVGCLGLMVTSSVLGSTLNTQEEKASYTIGIQLGQQLLISKEDINLDAIKLGMKDMFSGTKPRLSNDEMRVAMVNYQKSKQVRELSMMKKFSNHNQKEGLAFLNANKTKPGVKTLASGLQYKVLKSGTGKVSPKSTDKVVTHYHGTLIDGTVFDSSYDRGEAVSFPVNAVIKGWTEALQKMKVGDKWQLVIPSALAYGEQGAPPSIGPDATLIFDVELLKIN
ncbi:protein containing peptidyl-prolyl cis-trans iso merase, FKBP-type, N-terminal domain [Sulfurimonas gotlandica GD1]|uniref:Peptidyl-prolyl cis-trans isomerase n=2 Tax=Sulfurimonas TaxID=202746 RepID=H1FUT7_SULGG|nr:FKBP-type peptidyl-prolyl cis-trans isomerase [Sulfurimonas gotlandica]EHP28944.1 protein containing peptidyl-prolyl cis-trans iso merase, FKBP-type, N-terminal domain [Sulfurimonas gotlandica GD1]